MDKLISNKEVQSQIKDNKLVQQKQLRIASGASKLFIKKGYAATSMREISKATGITIGNLYDYITKKEDILYLVFDVFYSMWVNRLEEEGLLEEMEDPVKQLKGACQMMLELADKNKDMVKLLFTESKALPKYFLKRILQKESWVINCFEHSLRRGIEKKVFKIKDPFLVANILVHLLLIRPLRGWNLQKYYKNGDVNKYITEFIMGSVTR